MEQQNDSQNYLDKIALWFSTLGIGYLPLAPGTWASLVVCILYYYWITFDGLLVLIVIFIIGSWWLIDRAVRQLGRPDPPQIIADEIIGMSIALLFVPAQFWAIVIAFILFRFFDIKKIYPANLAEKLPGTLGIISDDIVAGVYAGILAWIIFVWL